MLLDRQILILSVVSNLWMRSSLLLFDFIVVVLDLDGLFLLDKCGLELILLGLLIILALSFLKQSHIVTYVMVVPLGWTTLIWRPTTDVYYLVFELELVY